MLSGIGGRLGSDWARVKNSDPTVLSGGSQFFDVKHGDVSDADEVKEVG